MSDTDDRGQAERLVRRLRDMADGAGRYDLDEYWSVCQEAAAAIARLLADAARYRWMRERFEWRRDGELKDEDSHAFVGCRFPYLANFSCAAMLDHNIDAMMNKPPNTR